MDDAADGSLVGMSRLSVLDSPVRRRLYSHVASSDSPVSRDEAASAAGISRTLAAYHLDRLVEAGLLRASYVRPAGRGGPGAGRPAKYFTRTDAEVAVSVPPRNYGLLAEVLAAAVAADGSGSLPAQVAAAARNAGRAAADSGDVEPDLLALLQQCGYQPAYTEDGNLELRNCPFHRIAQQHKELVCGANEQLLRGLLDGAGHPDARIRLDPRADRCCVLVELVPA
ncbi:MAG TPA: helix-turn-helix domain-containing protein [Nocardioidaceae bacterium]|nr:helix-turn-helix domain-containing protein [Nocardioidaceae bacterium]